MRSQRYDPALRRLGADRATDDRNTVIETFFAGITLTVCMLLAVRLLLSPRRRWGLDEWLRRQIAALRRRLATAARWRSARKTSVKAAEEAIRRARGGKWDGNVYRPRTFRRPRKPH